MAHKGDYGTVTWARFMARRDELVVRTSSDVAAGPVNELSIGWVRIGNKRVQRKNIITARVLARTTDP